MAIEIRQAIREDFESIQEFLREAYGPLAKYKGAARWNWQFIDNPAASGGVHGVPVWIALDGRRVVGQIALQPTRLWASGRFLEAGWIVDVMVLPAYRGQHLGHRLYEAIADTGTVLLTLTMAESTRRMAERLKAITLPDVYQFSRWRNPSSSDVARFLSVRTQHRRGWSNLSKALTRIGGAHALALIARATAVSQDRYLGQNRDFALRMEPVKRFDSSVDAFWLSHKGEMAGVPRTHESLNWRFAECPQLAYELFVVTRQKTPVGYAVLRRTEAVELRQGIIVDALLHRDHSPLWPGLFSLACEHFGRSVATVEAASSRLDTSEALRSCGFFRTRKLRPTVVCRDRRVLDDLREVKNWFFNKGDHDWDQIHLA